MSKPAQRGRFVTVEGQDGAGKTTNLDRVEQLVRDSGKSILRTREPGGTPLGEQVRKLVLDQDGPEIGAVSELLLIFAARSQHIDSVIRPALNAGTWVVCDRFTDATYAYQGGGRGIDATFIAELECRVQGDLRPDLTLLFDVDTATGTQRVGRDGDGDRFESEADAFKKRVRDSYLARARAEPDRIRVVDATRPLETVLREVESIMHGFIQSQA